MKSLGVENFGPIQQGKVSFGDLTVLVGPQATGKSLFLQLAKLMLDVGPIRREFKRFNIRWDRDVADFLALYFGEGMSALWDPATVLKRDGQRFDLASHIRRGQRRSKGERMFYIPAQRVITVRDGLTRPFTDYRTADPFVVREFSEKIHGMMQSELARASELFPQTGRLKSEYRRQIERHIFGRFRLRIDKRGLQRRIVLAGGPNDQRILPFLVWSAGQREFVPLLLGLYWLLPPTRVSRRDQLQWVVLEEPEMGLHPSAIAVVMALVLEFLRRDYKVCISTHSPHVLDIAWAMNLFKRHGGQAKDVLRIFQLRSTPTVKQVAESALTKDYRVFYFCSDGTVKDITGLDPGSDDSGESGWGGLTEFSGRVGEVVAEVVGRSRA